MIDLDNFSHRDRDRDPCHDRDDCRSVVKKKVGVKTPVAVDVSAKTGNVKVVCSTPHITNNISQSDCKSKTRCEFTINQTISVEIPISYHVKTDVKSSYVDCDVDRDC